MNSEPSHRNAFSISASEGQDGRLLGEHLRQLRKQRGLTLRDLARTVGVSPPALCRWEKGQARPRNANILALADAFKITPAALLEIDQAVSRDARAATEDTRLADQPLASAINDAKRKIAALAGTTADRVRITIEV